MKNPLALCLVLGLIVSCNNSQKEKTFVINQPKDTLAILFKDTAIK